MVDYQITIQQTIQHRPLKAYKRKKRNSKSKVVTIRISKIRIQILLPFLK